MARDGELPRVPDAVHPRFRVPHRAELVVRAVVVVLVRAVDLRGAIGFSSLGVLVHHAVANATAWMLPGSWWRRPVAVAGFGACAVLVVTLPLGSVVAGAVVLALGLGLRAVRLART